MENARHDPDAAMFESDELVEPPRWPKVVGTISIVWGGLSLLCGGCFLGMGVMTTTLVKGAEQQLGSPMPDVMKPTTVQLGVGGLGLLAPLLLIIAGVMLVSRKRVGVTLHLVYAVAAIVLGLAGAAVSIPRQLQQAEWVRQNPTDPWAQHAKPEIGFIMLGVFTLLGLAWPIFCLIWFGAVKRRAPLDIPREEIV